MKTILTIGYTSYLLPPSANVNVILKALSSAIELEHQWVENRTIYQPRVDPRELKIEVVADDQVITTKRKLIPQNAGPECNGEMV